MAWDYPTRAAELMLSGTTKLAYLELNTYADAMGSCPSCGASVSRYEAERLTHATRCVQLRRDVERGPDHDTRGQEGR